MLSMPHTPVRVLIAECERAAKERFGPFTRVETTLVPSLDGDFWRAQVKLPASGPSGEEGLGPCCHGRGKPAVVRALQEELARA